MDTFRRIYTPFGMLGIHSAQGHSIGAKSVMVLLLLGQYILSTAAYFLFEAKTIEEYSESFYILTTAALILFIVSVMIFKKVNIFQFIDDLREIIQKRKSLKIIHF